MALIKLAKVLKQIKQSEYFNHPEKEIFITVSGKGKGVSRRKIAEGKTPVPFSGYRVRDGQLIYSRIGASDGAFGLIDKNLNSAVVSKDFPIFEINEEIILKEYLILQLCSRPFINKIAESSSGATLKRLKEEQFLNVKVKIPSIDKQQKIISILYDVKDLISNMQNMLQTYDKLVKARFVEMFKDDNCEFKTISEISTYCSRGKSPKYTQNSNLKVINQACVYWNNINFDNIKYSEDTYCGDKLVNIGDILICSTGTGTLGRCNIFYPPNTTDKFIADSHVMILRLGETLLPQIFKIWFEQPKIQAEIYAKNVNGSTNQIELSKEKFKQLVVLVPPMKSQLEFVDFYNQVDKSKFVIQKSLEKTQMLFDSLMQEYFG